MDAYAACLNYCQLPHLQDVAFQVGAQICNASSYLVTACKTNDAFGGCLEFMDRFAQLYEMHCGDSKVLTTLRERYLSSGIRWSGFSDSVASYSYWLQGEWKDDWQDNCKWRVSGLFCLHVSGWSSVAKFVGDYPLKAFAYAAQQIGQIEAVSSAASYCLPPLEKALLFSKPVLAVTQELALKFGGLSAVIGGGAVIGKVCLVVHHAKHVLDDREGTVHAFSLAHRVFDLVSAGVLFIPTPAALAISLTFSLVSLGSGIHASYLKSELDKQLEAAR